MEHLGKVGISEKWRVTAWNGFNWLRIGTSRGILIQIPPMNNETILT
jgi:hypothetical protein